MLCLLRHDGRLFKWVIIQVADANLHGYAPESKGRKLWVNGREPDPYGRQTMRRLYSRDQTRLCAQVTYVALVVLLGSVNWFIARRLNGVAAP